MLLGYGSPSVRGEIAATVPSQWGTGTVAAIGYRRSGSVVPGRAVVVNLNTGIVNRLRFGFTIAGSAVWSPDNRYLLGHQVDLGSRYTGSYRVAVYDLLNDKIVPVPTGPGIDDAICAGWYRNEQILMYTERQCVLTFHAINITTGERHEVNAIRLPFAPGFQARVRLAAGVIASRADAITPV